VPRTGVRDADEQSPSRDPVRVLESQSSRLSGR
jgi:hypothetical protein